jgi:hypothetical protein
VASGAETVNAQPLGIACHHKRAPADQAGTQQWSDRNIVALFAKREGITGIGNGVRGETAIPRISSEQWAIAKILSSLPAETADTTSVSEPRDSNPFADPVRLDFAPDEVDTANDFVAWDDRVFDARQFRINDVKVGSADPARAYLDANFFGAWKRIITLLKPEKRARRGEGHRLQNDSPASAHPAVNATSGSAPSWIEACHA